MMTAHDEDRLLVEAVEAGASGFLSKDESAEEVLTAAKAAADGEVLIDPATLTRLLAQVAREREEQRDAMALLGDLTEREREILELLAQGKRNEDIAKRAVHQPADRADPRAEHPRASSGSTRSSRPSRSPSSTARSRSPDPRVARIPTRLPESGIEPDAWSRSLGCDAMDNLLGPATPSAGPGDLKARANPSLARAFIHCSGQWLAGDAAAGPSRSRVRGRVVHDRELARRLEPRQVLAAVLAELLEGRRVASDRRGTTHATTWLTPLGVRAPRDRDVGDRRDATEAPPRPRRATRSPRPCGSRRPTRPCTRSRPSSSSRPRSPVRSQPSTVNASAVAARIVPGSPSISVGPR